MLSPTTFALLQTRSQIEHSCQTALCFCWSPLHWQPRCVNTGGLYKYMRGLHDVWTRPYCEADTGNAGFVSNIWSLFFVFSLAAQVWILPERTANHKPPSRQACTLPAVWGTARMETSDYGCSQHSTTRYRNRMEICQSMPIRPDISSGPGWAVSPQGAVGRAWDFPD